MGVGIFSILLPYSYYHSLRAFFKKKKKCQFVDLSKHLSQKKSIQHNPEKSKFTIQCSVQCLVPLIIILSNMKSYKNSNDIKVCVILSNQIQGQMHLWT